MQRIARLPSAHHWESSLGVDPDLAPASSLKSYYDDRPNAHGMSPELMAYVRRAWEAGD